MSVSLRKVIDISTLIQLKYKCLNTHLSNNLLFLFSVNVPCYLDGGSSDYHYSALVSLHFKYIDIFLREIKPTISCEL